MAPRVPTNTEVANRGTTVSSAKRASYSLTIPSGAAVSNSLDLHAEMPVAIYFNPAAWTAASIGFDVSMDDVAFFPALAPDGTRIACATVTIGRALAIESRYLLGARFIRLRSINPGTGADVNQAADRSIGVITAP